MSFRGNFRAAVLLSLAPSVCPQTSQVPRVWDETALAEWPALLAELNLRPSFFRQHEYYAAAGDNFRSYPVYHPDRQPPDYWQKLNRLKPEKLVDASKLRTEAEWIAAGKRAWDELDTPSFRSSDPNSSLGRVRALSLPRCRYSRMARSLLCAGL
jgi:hypothetical protein